MILLLSTAFAAPLHVVETTFDPTWILHWEGDHIAALGSSGLVRVYDEELNEISSFDVGFNTSNITLSADGALLSTQSWRGRPGLYDVTDGKRLAKVPKPDRWSVPVVVAGEGGRYLVSAGGLLERNVDGAERVVATDLWANGPDAFGYLDGTPYFWENGRLHIYALSGETVLHTNAAGWAVKPAGDGFVLFDYGRASEYVGLDGSRRTLGFGNGSSATFATSADLVAVVDASGSGVELWEHQTGQLRATLRGGTGMVQSMAFSPEEDRIAVAMMDGIVQVHEVPVRPPLELGAAPGSPALVLAVDVPGDRGLAVWSDGDAVVWDLDTGAIRRRHHLPVQAGWGTQRVAVSPELSWVLVADDKGAAQRIDLSTGERIGGLVPGSTSQTVVAVGPDASYAVASDSWLRTWSSDGELVAELPMTPPGLLAVGHGGTRLVTADWSGNITFWDAESGVVLATRHPVEVWGSIPTALRVVDDGVVVVDSTGAHLWRPEGDDADTAYESPVLGAISGDGRAVALMNWEGQAEARDLDGTSLGEVTWGGGTMGSSVTILAVDGGGGLLLANTLGQVVWSNGDSLDVLTGALPEVWGIDEHQGSIAVSHAFGVRVFDPQTGATRVLSDEGVLELAFLPDGSLAGVGAESGEAPRYAWDLSTGERQEGPPAWDVDESRSLGWEMDVPGAKLKRRQRRALSGPIVDCPDGSRVLAAEYGWGSESTLFIVDPAGRVFESDLSTLGQVAHRCAQIPGLTSAPGGNVAAVGTSSGFVFLVDVRTGEVLAGLAGDGSQVSDIVQRGDGSTVVGYGSGALRFFAPDGSFVEERLFYEDGTTLAHDGGSLR